MQANKQKNITEVLTTKAVPISMAEAQRLAREHFGVSAASISPLDSERDQNFHLKADDDREYVMKIANPAEDRQVTNLQTGALLHIAAVDPAFPVPHVFPALSGELEPLIALKNGTLQTVRLLSYMQGIPLQNVKRTSAQRCNMGGSLARLGLALRGFFHPAAGHELLWDVKHADRVQQLLVHIADSGKRALAARFLNGFENNALPLLPGLRAQIIHGDFHPDNILVYSADHDSLAGVIDFGDCVHTPLINDLAVACSYHITDNSPQPLDFAAEMTGAYHKVAPLEPAEINILFDLIAARLAMGVAINGWRAALYPENAEYIMSNDAQKWRALERLAVVPHEKARHIFTRACGME
jgi:Ser/Thr protein kinase RdoA (MazF antagonist)